MLKGTVETLLSSLLKIQKKTNIPLWLCGGDSAIFYDQLKKFHKGHIVPFSKSKDSSKENLIIQTPEENLKLGAKEAI